MRGELASWHRALVAVSLLAAVAAGAFVRYELWLRFGGLEAEYLPWAMVHYFGGIAVGHLNSAQLALSGNWKALELAYPPGYAILLGAVQRLGVTNVQDIRLLQALLDAAAAVLAYDVAARLGCGRVASLVAAFVYALSPWWAQGSQFLMAEALLPVGVLALLALSVRLRGVTRPAAWAALGVAGASLALLRADMQLLGGALAAFALVSGGHGRGDRLRAALTTAAGFASVLALWGLMNLRVHGELTLGNRAGFYALWSGLGQVHNDYGYVVSDDNAGRILTQRGLGWHTAGAEAYWRDEYLKAWREHPRHVLATIVHRWRQILFSIDYSDVPLFRMEKLVRSGPYLLALALLLSLKRGDAASAMITVGPTAYALLSLGFVYVEDRYVRYASLSYLFALVLLLGALLNLLQERLPRPAKALLAVYIVAFLGREGFYALRDLEALYARGQAVIVSYAARLVPEAPWQSLSSQCKAPAWRADVPGASVASSTTGDVRIKTDGKAQYQAVARLGLRGAAVVVRARGAAVVVRARAHAQAGAAVALLPRTGGPFVDYQLLTPSRDVEVRLAASLPPASPDLVVITTTATGVSDLIELWDLGCRYLCFPPQGTSRPAFVFRRADLLRAYPLRDCAAPDSQQRAAPHRDTHHSTEGPRSTNRPRSTKTLGSVAAGAGRGRTARTSRTERLAPLSKVKSESRVLAWSSQTPFGSSTPTVTLPD